MSEATAPLAVVEPPDTGAGEVFPATFGPYVLLHRLASGGMGAVFLAKTGGSVGIEKHCVVKTLRGRFTHDAEYVERFIEEARVVVQLSHRNICPVFDVGRIDDRYYLAMELVLGRDVRTLQNTLRERGRALPAGLGVHIGCEMLDALDYAHRHVDPVSGEPLHLVHRDVSPQNVMLTHEGEVKLIDFGLAEKDRPLQDVPQSMGSGTVMGKMAYMAPEQARGEIVDARADQFSAAVVLYELLVGARYYEGLRGDQLWLVAGTGAYRPPRLPAVDAPLRAVLERALAPQRELRFATCGDFREALLACAASAGHRAQGRELRQLMGELFVADLLQVRELLQRFAHVSNTARPGFVTPAGRAPDVFSIATSVHAAQIHDPTSTMHVARTASPPTRRWRVAGAAAAAVVALVAVTAALAVRRGPPPAPAVAAALPAPQTPAPAPPPSPPPPAAPSPEPEQRKAEERPLESTARPHAVREPARRRPKRAEPSTPVVDWRVRLDYLKAHCPALPCTSELWAGIGKPGFLENLAACTTRCKQQP